MVKIAVVGAGVVGLSSALCLRNEISDSEVTVIAEHWYGDATSNGPPGLFRPDKVASVNPLDATKWIESSWERYSELYSSKDAGDAGISRLGGYIFSNDDPLLPACQQYCHLAQNFRRLQGKELDGFGGPWKYGSFHSSFIIEPSLYLKYLSAEFQAFGGRFEERALRSLTELHGKFDVVVNCCGLGASVLTKDETMVPVRGQLVRIDAPWIKEFYMAESTTYIYPNRDTVVLGGTRQIGDSCIVVRPLETEEIVGRCQQILPAIQNAPIVSVWAGLRPWRPTVRLETEDMYFDEGRSDVPLRVVHNYGHGGNGISLSWGCAVHATQLVKGILLCI